MCGELGIGVGSKAVGSRDSDGAVHTGFSLRLRRCMLTFNLSHEGQRNSMRDSLKAATAAAALRAVAPQADSMARPACTRRPADGAIPGPVGAERAGAADGAAGVAA